MLLGSLNQKLKTTGVEMESPSLSLVNIHWESELLLLECWVWNPCFLGLTPNQGLVAIQPLLCRIDIVKPSALSVSPVNLSCIYCVTTNIFLLETRETKQ